MKDPKRPIIKKKFIKFSDKLCLISDDIKYPIKKEPTIFTEIVPYILEIIKDLIILTNRYLRTAPSAPPVATNIKFNNLIKLEVDLQLLQ